MIKCISYATDSYKSQQKRFVDSCSRFNIQTRSYSPLDLDNTFIVWYNNILSQPRGAGYWLWKPYIILNEMYAGKEDDYIFYCDSDVQMIANPEPLCEETDIILCQNYDGIINRDWVKKECYDLCTWQVTMLPHLEACVVGFKNTQANKTFVERWFAYCKSERYNTDKQFEPQIEGFKDHRHDQAILTMLKYEDDIKECSMPLIKQYFDIGK